MKLLKDGLIKISHEIKNYLIFFLVSLWFSSNPFWRTGARKPPTIIGKSFSSADFDRLTNVTHIIFYICKFIYAGAML